MIGHLSRLEVVQLLSTEISTVYDFTLPLGESKARYEPSERVKRIGRVKFVALSPPRV